MSVRISAAMMREGWAVLPHMLSGRELAAVVSAARHVREQASRLLGHGLRFWDGRTDRPEEMEPAAVVPALWKVEELTRPDRQPADLFRPLGSEGAAEAIESLFPEGARYAGSALFWSPQPTGMKEGWSRGKVPASLMDWVHCRPEASDQVRLWLALRPAECWWAVPGSHRRSRSAGEKLAMERGGVDPEGARCVRLSAGDALVWDPCLLRRRELYPESEAWILEWRLQATWMPECPWLSAEDENRIRDPSWQASLPGAVAPIFRRLGHGVPGRDPWTYLREAAKARGWRG